MKSFKRHLFLWNSAAVFALLFLSSMSFFLGLGFFLAYLVFFRLGIRRFTKPFQQLMDLAFFPSEEKTPDWIVAQFGKTQDFLHFGLKISSLLDAMREQSERSSQKDLEMEDILNSLNEGVIAFNVSAQVTFSNRKAATVFPHVCKGKSLLQGDEKLLQRCHKLVLKALQTSEIIQERWMEQGIYLNVIASPLVHREGAILVLQDTTSDHKILEIGRSFIANASHELRTPITIISGFAEMLQNVSQLPLKTTEEVADKIVRTCDRLNKLIQGLLTLSGLEHREKRLEPCPLLPLLDHCKHLLLIAHPHAYVAVSSTVLNPTVLADPDLLDLAIMNLLENGVKYSGNPEKAQMHLQVETAGEEVVVQLQDWGMGIAKQDLPHIFDRFYTVDKARQKKAGGVGLGLSIVKSIIDKHGGRIDVVSVPGQGTTFTISLKKPLCTR